MEACPLPFGSVLHRGACELLERGKGRALGPDEEAETVTVYVERDAVVVGPAGAHRTGNSERVEETLDELDGDSLLLVEIDLDVHIGWLLSGGFRCSPGRRPW